MDLCAGCDTCYSITYVEFLASNSLCDLLWNADLILNLPDLGAVRRVNVICSQSKQQPM